MKIKFKNYEIKNSVVTRNELMHSVWNDVVVSDDTITKAAFDLLKFFRAHGVN